MPSTIHGNWLIQFKNKELGDVAQMLFNTYRGFTP